MHRYKCSKVDMKTMAKKPTRTTNADPKKKLSHALGCILDLLLEDLDVQVGSTRISIRTPSL